MFRQNDQKDDQQENDDNNSAGTANDSGKKAADQPSGQTAGTDAGVLVHQTGCIQIFTVDDMKKRRNQKQDGIADPQLAPQLTALGAEKFHQG